MITGIVGVAAVIGVVILALRILLGERRGR